MDLISELKEEHVEIVRLFACIKEELEGKSKYENPVDELRRLRDVLVNHLELEDKLLYPELIKAKGKAEEIGEKFSEEMLKISEMVFAFFGKYMEKPIEKLLEDSKFKEELDKILKSVGIRIKKEETILFPAYEKYCEHKF